MRTHMVMDMVTGEIKVQGREGRCYLPEEVDRAMKRADSGDAAAAALLADVDFENKNGIDVIDPMQLLHDCPECRAALERGEQPQIIAGEALERLFAEALRAELSARPRRANRKRRRWR
jgi:hypothetical protein